MSDRDRLIDKLITYDPNAEGSDMHVPHAGPVADAILALDERLTKIETVLSDFAVRLNALEARTDILEDETEPAGGSTSGLSVTDVLALVREIKS